MQGRFREETIQVFKDQNQLCIKDKRCLEDLANSLIDVVWEKLSNSISKSDFGRYARAGIYVKKLLTNAFRVGTTASPIISSLRLNAFTRK